LRRGTTTARWRPISKRRVAFSRPRSTATWTGLADLQLRREKRELRRDEADDRVEGPGEHRALPGRPARDLAGARGSNSILDTAGMAGRNSAPSRRLAMARLFEA